MAYTPIRTVIVSKGRLIESENLDATLESFDGKEAYLVLENNKALFTVDIGKMKLFESGLVDTTPIGSAFTSRFNDAFVTKYRTSDIPVKNAAGTYSKRLRVFSPMSYKDHKVSFTSISTPSIVDDVTKKGYLDDLVITTRDDMTNYLVAVDGVFHKTTIHEGKLYVLDGFRTMRLTDRKDVTVVDTKSIGGHTVMPLTSANVSQTTYNGIATITSPTSLRNKSVFLVVDGYFYHMDNDIFYYADDKHLKVRMNKLPLIDQFRHNPRTIYHADRFGEDATQRSRKYEDAYDAVFFNKRQVPTSTFTTRDFQYSRLTAYHSFLVIVNNPSLFTISSDIVPTGTPQFYMDAVDRVLSGMLSYSAGLCPSYLILRDPFKRKSIFIQKQDYDLDIQKNSLSPAFIPTLIPETEKAAKKVARFVDYVSA